MSPRRTPVRLSPKARQDFIEILRYTGETWGPEQLLAYRDKIDEALALLSRNPGLGHTGVDLPEGLRIYAVGVHLIIYRIQENGLGVARILHQRMRLTQHLPEN